jgi:hypothetical protein
MQDLIAAGTCGQGTFPHALAPQHVPWEVTIDLSGLIFCEPLGLVGIAAFAEAAIHRGDHVQLIAPERPNVARYLSRMHLAVTLSALGVEHDLPAVRERALGNTLLQLTRFEGTRGADRLAEHVHGLVEPHDFGAANVLYRGISELGQNVADHSRRDQGFLAAQLTHRGSQLLFAVGDSGVGLLETLRTHGATTDAEALLKALERGVTELPGRFAGVGLSDTSDELTAAGGSLHLLSGRASLTVHRRVRHSGRSLHPVSGTLLQATLPLPRR